MKKVICALLAVFAMIFHLSAQNDLLSLFPKQLIDAKGKTVDTKTALEGKIVAVYFSASWCGPCRGFTPQLVQFHKRVARRGLEVVFVSSDRNENDMMNYMKKDSMPWLAVPFKDPAVAKLKRMGKVRGIPQLMILDPSGKIISQNGRWDVVILQRKALNAWKSPDYKPKTYQDYKNNNQNKRNRRSRR